MTRQHPPRKRVKIAQAVSILGLEPRTVRDMAARGEIPGAAKPRGIWTFDAALLDQYNQARETEICQRANEAGKLQRVVSGAVTSSTAAFRSAAKTSNGHYGQTIQKLRRLAAERSGTAR
ncbi:helix-turn-helix domain-containing protein [Bradyrhizobium yuanmingense]|uniref:helix-turn-helix domain-containing protein n=1 Tax=Bradyrhizobium yuanmingense TaxID=108015 RepID=UPI00055FDC39|nr:helix-turn-helix domain-containing protein [Bradyrhizobium yuanmingense]